ncbi:MAG: energy transducer TonB [Spongiibacter sp.]
MNSIMTANTSAEPVHKKATVQSAETFIAVVLFAVCATAGVAAWLINYLQGDEARFVDSIDTVQVYASLADGELASEEDAVLEEWRQRLETSFSQREQALQQQEQNAMLAEQAAALAAAQAAAEEAKLAAEQAEQRARSAEIARRNAMEARRERAEAKVAPAPPREEKVAKVSANAVRVPASVDWSTCDKPRYPRAAVRLKQEGTVTLAFSLSASGEVLDGRVQESSGTSRLDNAALEAIVKCQFTPETLDGRAQPSTALVRFGWRLNG